MTAKIATQSMDVAVPPAEVNIPSVWRIDNVPGLVVDDAVMDRHERRFAAGLSTEVSAAAYRLTRVALRQLLAVIMNESAAEVEIVHQACGVCGQPHGRPEVAASAGLHFSVARSHEYSLIALAHSPIGVDVERRVSLSTARRVRCRLHVLEQVELKGIDGESLEDAFTLLWARKEAVLKATGMGLSRGLQLDYVGSGPDPSSPHGWRVHDVSMPRGYFAAVAFTDLVGP